MREIILDEFQKKAIKFAKENYSIVVSAPTGSGKTLIAEYIIEDCLKNQKGVIYTAPIKALSNQKFRDFSKKYPQNVGILTGDVSINRSAPILIMTTEIFRNAILVNPEEFQNYEWVIFDEIHYLDDIERGTVWEEAIILLPKHMKMLALSATISNIEEFINWLKQIHSHPVESIIEKHRPVPLHFFFQCNNQFFYSLKELKKTGILKEKIKIRDFENRYFNIKKNRLTTLIDYLIKNNALPCLYFSFSRRRCEELAKEASIFDFLKAKEKKEIISIFEGLIEKFELNSNHINFLYPLIEKGIAYHHAGLLPTLKEIIEQLFTTGLIKLIFTTETFALGINMPSRSVVFDKLNKFYGRYQTYLKTRDFYQMAGRAGRRGIDKEGYVFLKINPFSIDLSSLERMLYGKYEPINSQLNSCYATILNLYRIMGNKLYDVYPKSFHFQQAKFLEKKETLELLKRKISLLEKLGYIVQDKLSFKAELASKVYSFELQIGELFSEGFLDNLDPKELFIVISSLVYEPRRGEKSPFLNKRIKKLRDLLREFIDKIHKEERIFRIYPLSKNFYFHLVGASIAWFEGESFYKLNKYCDVDEGEIVRYFRMATQVFREIYSAEVISPSLKTKISKCLNIINRDVVDAEKQLRHEI